MKLVVISDTHGKHWDVELPTGDMLIHAGDMCSYGSRDELQDASEWLKKQRESFEWVIAIAGNHDWAFVKHPDIAQRLMRDAGIIYLQDSAVEIEGFKIYGSPWTPTFSNWAFMKDPGTPIREIWDKIPVGTDILITHGPAYGILDPGMFEPHSGCPSLRNRIVEIKPKIHISGHLHAGYGRMDLDGVTHINAAQLNDKYQLVNKPIEVEL